MFHQKSFALLASIIFSMGFSMDSFAATTHTRSVSKTTASGSANNRTYTTNQKVYSNGRQVASSTTKTTVKRR